MSLKKVGQVKTTNNFIRIGNKSAICLQSYWRAPKEFGKLTKITQSRITKIFYPFLVTKIFLVKKINKCTFG